MPISDIFRATFRFYRAYAPLLGGYLAWFLIPYTCLVIFQLVPDKQIRDTGEFIFGLATGIAGIWIFILLSQVIHGIIHNKETAPSVLRKQTINFLLPVVSVSLLYSLIVFGGILLLIVPGIIFLVWFACAQYAVILDGKRGWNAFTFSKSLTKGRFFRAAAMIYAGPIVFAATLTLLELGMLVILSFLGGITISFASNEAPLWLQIADTLIQLFIVIPLALTYSIFAYDVLKQQPTNPL